MEEPKANAKRLAERAESNKAIVANIEKLEEERDRLAKEKKRCQEDIDALYTHLKKRIKNPNQEELNLEVVQGKGGAASATES